MIIAKTPFRVSFFGGGTDFPDFFRKHGGATLSVTMDKYSYLSVHPGNPLSQYAYRINYSRTEEVKFAHEIKHPLVRETLKYTKTDKNLEITYNADLPGRTGLGTSSSFTVGLLNALSSLRSEYQTPEDLARGAIQIEREMVGDIGGWQDQYAAAYGGFLRLDFQKDDAVRVRCVALTADQIHNIQEHTLFFYTGSDRNATELQKDQNKKIQSNTDRLLQMKKFVDMGEKLLTQPDGLTAFGDLLHETWIRKKELAKGITNPFVDEAYAVARAAGALGGKLLGAGGHGFVLIFAPPSKTGKVRKVLSGLTEVPIRFCTHGSHIIYKS